MIDQNSKHKIPLTVDSFMKNGPNETNFLMFDVSSSGACHHITILLLLLSVLLLRRCFHFHLFLILLIHKFLSIPVYIYIYIYIPTLFHSHSHFIFIIHSGLIRTNVFPMVSPVNNFCKASGNLSKPSSICSSTLTYPRRYK